MKEWINPPQSEWEKIIARPTGSTQVRLRETVREIIFQVQQKGMAALQDYSARFDNYRGPFKLNQEEWRQLESALDPALKQAIDEAYAQIYDYHQKTMAQYPVVERIPGLRCWHESRAIESVGLYIPGGSAPLFSTVLMLGVPSQIAANPNRVLITPPMNANGAVHPAVLYAARKCGIEKVFRLGGAHGIAALSTGIGEIPKVDKLFGPGNAYVTEAKMQAFLAGTAIDMPAGPSEVLVIADPEANPQWIAADLLAQAEHGPDSQVVFIGTDLEQLRMVNQAVERQLSQLPRQETAQRALLNSHLVLVEDLKEAFALSNRYAPEHLILALKEPHQFVSQVQTAGSVFLGYHACESLGDYASGPNHTLPTAGFARAFSGIKVSSFQKEISFQAVNAQALQKLGPLVERMARAEGLTAHERALSVRLESLPS